MTQILTRVVLEYPFQQQGPELTASQYVALLLPVSVFFKKKYLHSWSTWFLTFGFTVFLQLLKKWAPVFKNYVKRAQDHLDCLTAFEEHFLDQESHWPAMVKVRGSAAWLQVKSCYQCLNSGFPHPGSKCHVPAGDPGGGDHPALVLPGSYHRQAQKATQEPEGISPRWRAGLLTVAIKNETPDEEEAWAGTAWSSFKLFSLYGHVGSLTAL